MALRIPLSPGAFAGPYEIMQLLSDSGGSALVYYARKNDRLYVLKELYPTSMSRRLKRCSDGSLLLTEGSEEKWTDCMQRFESEAQNYAQLQREFARDIIPGALVQTESAYTFFCEAPVRANGTLYLPIVTRSGETLYSYALKLYTGSHDPGSRLMRTLDIMIALCEAVERLHALNRLHLDLKPDNLFITDGQLKLLDFGSMISLDNPHPSRSYTQGFSAPELSGGAGYLTEKECVPCAQSDVFSICAIFYWMIFGRVLPENAMFYSWELSISRLSPGEFPELLTGFGLNVINGCLLLLQKGMTVLPAERHESIAALKADFESARRSLAKELEDSARRDPSDVFMESVSEAYAFRNILPSDCRTCIEDGNNAGRCGSARLLACRLMNSYINRKIARGIPLIVNETRPLGCISYVTNRLRSRNQYDEALFALQFLNHHTDLESWHPTALGQLYAGITDLAMLLGRDELGREYFRLAEEYRDPSLPSPSTEFNALNEYESAFCFDGMVAESRRIILDRWGSEADKACSDVRAAVLRTILSYRPAPKMLVSHAGRYVEGLCLARSEGWKEDSAAILQHLLGHTEHVDEGFRARTVDNMLHFCIETGDHIRFLQTLPLLPDDPEVPESMMRPSGGLLKWKGKREPAIHVEDWLIETAERFAAGEMQAWFDSFQYMLYLYLQSVNAFFGKYLKKPDVAKALLRLCTTIESTLKEGPVQHPKQLILKHAALIAIQLGSPLLVHKLRALLVRCTQNGTVGVVRVISDGALLTVDRAMGRLDPAFQSLVSDIRYGISDGIFRPELFLGSMEDPDALLHCFRFKHT